MDSRGNRNDAKRQRLTYVDTEGRPTTSSGVSRPALDPVANGLAKRVLYHAHCAVMCYAGMEEKYYKNLEIMCLITSNLWTAHTVIKQEINGKGTVKNRVDNNKLVTLGNASLKPEEFVNVLRGVFVVNGLIPGTEAYEKIKGCFQTHLAQMFAFKLRKAEVQYMNRDYRVGTAPSGKPQVVQMELYGVQMAHMALSHGANFPPSLQTAMLQQMGPATLLVGLCRQDNNVFKEKWERAVNQQMSGVANMAEVSSLIAGRRGKAKDYIEKVLDICAAGVVKSSCKGSIPWLFYFHALKTSADFMAWFGTMKMVRDTAAEEQQMELEGEEDAQEGGSRGPRQQEPQAKYKFNFGEPLTDALVHPSIKDLDMSGKGFWNFYRLASGLEFETKHLEAGNADHYCQAISLAMTGLYYEDIATIRHVFGRDPYLRKETTASFTDLSKKGTPKPVQLWPVRYVAKMATAAQSKWGIGQDHHIIPAYRISGRGTQRITESSPLAKRLGATKDHADTHRHGEAALLDALTRQAARIRTGVLHDGSLETGTTEWFKVDENSKHDCYGTAVNIVVDRTGLTIFSSTRNIE